MANIIAILLIVLLVTLASRYIYKAKKKGVKCIGCSSGGSCSCSCGGCSEKN